MDRCRECGDEKRLNRGGVCAWRAGCEHRQLVHTAAVDRLIGEMDAADEPFPCGHTRAQHRAQQAGHPSRYERDVD